jgi:hypothetical protein
MKELPEMLKPLEIDITDEIRTKILNVSTSDHTRKQGHTVSDAYEPVTWDDLECEDAEICMLIRDQAIRYGYEV